jgi:N-acetyl sugar amidotransferase
MAFDAEGVCAACRVAERKAATDWKVRREELETLLAGYRRSDGRFDVVCPGSGGKDSVYAAHLMRDEFGMHPLTVTWAPMLYTDVGRRNFETWVRNGFTNHLVTPNPRVHARLTRLAFLNLLNSFQPFVLGQRSLPTRFAARHGINLVVYGEDDEDYEGAAGWQEQREVHDAPDELQISGVPWSQLVRDHQIPHHDLAAYLPISSNEAAQVTSVALGRYVRWRPQDAYYFAADRGFQPNDQRTEGTYTTYASIDDKLDPLHYYTMLIKFGVGRASHDASHEVRNGHLTREEGVALVRKYDTEFPGRYFVESLQYMGLSVEEFHATCDRFRPEDLWKRDGIEWRLRRQVT